MDYEKKYKEALKRVREKRDEYKRLDGEESFVPSDIEYIFPELKESEDEKNKKIKKEVIGMLHYYHAKSPCFIPPKFSLEETLTWLEKQGAQKPSWSEEDSEWYMVVKESILERWKGTDNKDLIEIRDGALEWLKSLKQRIGG